MKNFPHQINQIPRLMAALDVLDGLISRNADVSDDAVFGYALARAGVYKFQDMKGLSLEERIEVEKRRKSGDQGPRTCARELRRFFQMLGFIEEIDDFVPKQYRLTYIGLTIHIAHNSIAHNNDAKIIDIWRDCLRNIVVEDESGVSHPYCILLKLVNDFSGIERKRLALALEAMNDSDEEYQRVSTLAQREIWEGAISASPFQQANAVKILPALAIQAGDISETNGRLYPISSAPLLKQIDNRIKFVVSRKVNAETIAGIPTFQDDETETDLIPKYLDSQKTRRLIQQRTTRHQQLVQNIAQILEDNGYKLSENPMDCLAMKDNSATFLLEAKTIDQTSLDEVRQVRLALGQLTYYENFYVKSQTPIIMIALFDKEISDAHIEYLEKYGCYSLWDSGEGILGSEKTMEILVASGIEL